MALSGTFNFELTAATIIRRAFQLAGLMHASHSPSGDDITLATDLLNVELQEFQMEWRIQQTIERTTLALVDGTREYTLPANIIDVEIGADNVVGTYVPSSGAETRVYLMTRQEYVEKSDKTTEALPTMVAIERTAPVKLVFWPIPFETASFRYSKIKLVNDVTPTTKTVDLARQYQGAIIYALAYALGFAKTIPEPRLARLERERDRRKEGAKRNDVQRGNAQLVVSH